jgi:diguanylate cyclase (GGDEF)-like protein
VRNKDGIVEAVAGTARNITERKFAEDKNWEKANYDQLTKLPNRRLFHDRLTQAVNHAARIGAPIALLFIDLDHFKEVNDKFGHDAGDVLLQRAADRMRSCVREADTVARLGGDEFIVILQDQVSNEQVETVARKIQRELAIPFQISNDNTYVSASIGITLYPQDGNTTEQLIKNADQAMYEAKYAGRNCFSFWSPDALSAARHDYPRCEQPNGHKDAGA